MTAGTGSSSLVAGCGRSAETWVRVVRVDDATRLAEACLTRRTGAAERAFTGGSGAWATATVGAFGAGAVVFAGVGGKVCAGCDAMVVGEVGVGKAGCSVGVCKTNMYREAAASARAPPAPRSVGVRCTG